MALILKWMWLVSILGFCMLNKCEADGGDTNNTDPVVSSITAKLNSLPQVSSDWCIFKVPQSFGEINEEPYTPKLVSIGPFHHGTQSLQPMEVHKLRLLKEFVSRKPEKSIEYYVGNLRGVEEKARLCYGENITLTNDDFLEMLLIDASFIIEFIIQYDNVDVQASNDSIFSSIWMTDTIVGDMQLIENQLPFFVLDYLFNLFNSPLDVYKGFSLLQLTQMLFSNDLNAGRNDLVGNQVKHFVDLFRQYYAPSSRKLPKGKESFRYIPSATELHQIGIKFRWDKVHHLLDVSFKNKALSIPRLSIRDSTEDFLRNVIVFEQFNNDPSYISDYVTLMNSLINTAEDVAFLRECGIIDNWLGDDEDVSLLFNNLGKETFFNTDTFYYAALFEDVNASYKKLSNWWFTKLKRDFITPMSNTSFYVATVLLVCTIVQTLNSCSSKD